MIGTCTSGAIWYSICWFLNIVFIGNPYFITVKNQSMSPLFNTSIALVPIDQHKEISRKKKELPVTEQKKDNQQKYTNTYLQGAHSKNLSVHAYWWGTINRIRIFNEISGNITVWVSLKGGSGKFLSVPNGKWCFFFISTTISFRAGWYPIYYL